MSFFKKYNGTTNKKLARLETLIWASIYGGLLLLVIGFFMERAREGQGMLTIVGGAILVVFGAVLIYLRSRLREEP